MAIAAITASSSTTGAITRGTCAQAFAPTSHQAQAALSTTIARYSQPPVIRPRISSTPAMIIATPASK